VAEVSFVSHINMANCTAWFQWEKGMSGWQQPWAVFMLWKSRRCLTVL